MLSRAERTRDKMALADPARWLILELGGPGCSWPARSSWRTPKGSGWWTLWSHICGQINREGQLGSEKDPQPRAPVQGNKASNH